MILDEELWMNIRRYRSLHESGATYVEIARECGVDWRTVKKYLAPDAPVAPPPAPPRAGTQPRAITPELELLIRSWLAKDIELKASVIHERLVDEHGFTGHYQRVKMACQVLRPAVAAELDLVDENRLVGLHRRFSTIPGAQAQVDWGDEGDLFGVGRKVYSFHMVLSFSRDPFACFTTSMDAATFWDCHRRAFDHFGGVPGAIVYDRTKTIVKRHVAPGKAVPLHPEAVAFAGHYGFVIDVLAARRPTGKGRVERQVTIVRDHVLAGRSFTSLAQADAAFQAWVPIRRRQVHRTTGHLIGIQAVDDAAALRPIPLVPYVVTDTHLRRVGKDCLVSFEASLYSVPAKLVRAGQRVEVRPTASEVTIRAQDVDGGAHLACHPRAQVRGTWVIDPSHWDGLPDGRTRATTIDVGDLDRVRRRRDGSPRLEVAPHVARALSIPVGVRPLADYATAAGMGVRS
jgi:transposase